VHRIGRVLRVLAVVVLLLVLLVVGAVAYARPLLLTGTGYAAHNACAVALVAGRGADAAADDLPDNPLVPYLRTTVDEAGGFATATVLGMFGQTAWYTPGLGCTLAADRPALTAPAVITADALPDADAADVDRDRLDAALDAAFAEDDPDGRTVGTRAVVVLLDGAVVAERYADGFDADTPQLGWSMAKSVTNAMVGRLVADGVLATDDDALRPAWTDGRAAITLDDLLRMRSGLAWEEAYELGSTITDMLYLEPDMGAFAADQPLVHPPGRHQQYSSGTTNVICDVLGDATGRGSAMAAELVFEPAGMASAVLEPDAAGDPVCSSYLWATPRDWARFGAWFLRGGDGLLPEDWLAYSARLEPVGGEDEGHAAHWWVPDADDGFPAGTLYAAGHDGQRLYLVPDDDLVVLRMGFTPDIPSDELGYERWVREIIAAIRG
jgi:CubicO group peptidase (beta-lactamase class C family)